MTTTAVMPDRPEDHPDDPAGLADAAGTLALLRCWVRETGLAPPVDGVLRLDLACAGTTVEAPVTYWSATGWHSFGPAGFAGGTPVDAVTLAALLTTESVWRRGNPGSRAAGAAAIADLAGRVADSVRRTARHVEQRRAAPHDPAATTPFLRAEQALLLGHPLHPTPKSRDGISDADAAAYSPELRGSFPLHWFAADPTVVSSDSGLARPAEQITAALAGDELRLPPDTVAVPAHPWQARDVLARPDVRALLDAGLLHDLGPTGPPWSPTSSVRTVYRADAPVMLKLSLGLRITNSKRENLQLELARGMAVHRLLEAGLGAALRTAHPGFDVVRDPAWIAVDTPARPESGLEVVIRDNPFGGDEQVACVAGLVAERPDLPHRRSALATLVHRLAAKSCRSAPDVAQEWFARYLDAVVVPVLWLYGAHGLGLEAHQQNTLVVLDAEGWPVGGRYRDNQGYYFSETRSGGLSRWLPGAGRDLGTLCPDEVIDERLGYYVGVNNVLGLIGAMGSQQLADEGALLVTVREVLARLAGEHGAALQLAGVLLDSPTLRCKANLLTRVDGLDELVGPLDAQSVYADVGNPIAEVGA
ncbi:MAG: siderophore biosynthesis protein [Pseudonocardiaceae bacterium]|nr:siderophore biosynthesis protein [Pseudonocardiaceae bacterium]